MNDESNARQRIIRAYLDVLKTKAYDKVTVSSIIRKADVNRSTFYRHFIDIYDLYENICEETADEIVREICDNMMNIFNSGHSLEMMRLGYEALYDVFVNNKEIISLLAGKNGSLLVVKKFRDRCEGNLTPFFPLFDKSDDFDYQSGLMADVSVLFVYSMYAFRTGEDLLKLKTILPNTALKKDFMANILSVNDVLHDTKSGIEYKLLLATYKAWQKKKTINLTVRDITEEAGVSRTEFYICHKNIADFYANFENIATYVLSKYIIEVAFSDDASIKDIKFEMKEVTESISNFISSIEHMRLFTFLFRTCGVVIDKYFQILKKEYGDGYVSGNEYNIMFYMCAVFNIVVRYATTGNEERFIRSVKSAVNFKKMFEEKTGIL